MPWNSSKNENSVASCDESQDRYKDDGSVVLRTVTEELTRSIGLCQKERGARLRIVLLSKVDSYFSNHPNILLKAPVGLLLEHEVMVDGARAPDSASSTPHHPALHCLDNTLS